MMSIPTLPADSTRHAPLVLALCPALAVSDTVANALGLSAIAIIAAPLTTLAAAMLKRLPDEIRWHVQVLVLAASVSGCALLLNAWSPELYRSLGVFVPLLIANALLVSCATQATTLAVPNAIASGMRAGTTVALLLLVLGLAREIVGHGSVLHNAGAMFGDWAGAARLQLFRADMGFLLAMLPPGAFIAFGLLLAGLNWIGRKNAQG